MEKELILYMIDFSDDRDIDRFIEKFEKRGASAEIRNNK